MIELQATGHLLIKVPMVMANARGLLDAGRAVLKEAELTFDLSEVVDADSSALAVMLGLLRAAALSRATLKFVNVPAGVLSLAELYGVAELLPLV